MSDVCFEVIPENHTGKDHVGRIITASLMFLYIHLNLRFHLSTSHRPLLKIKKNVLLPVYRILYGSICFTLRAMHCLVFQIH